MCRGFVVAIFLTLLGVGILQVQGEKSGYLSDEIINQLESRLEEKLVLHISDQLSKAMRAFRQDVSTIVTEQKRETTAALTLLKEEVTKKKASLEEHMKNTSSELNKLRQDLTERIDKLENLMDLKFKSITDQLARKEDKKCPPSWTKLTSSFCFQVVQSEKTWEDAKSHCQSVGARLVTFKDKNEFYAFTRLPEISDLMNQQSKKVWIGIRRTSDDLVFEDRRYRYFRSYPEDDYSNKIVSCYGARYSKFIRQVYMFPEKCNNQLQFVCRNVVD